MRRLHIGALIFCAATLSAQNLVDNGDFESYSACPDYVSQIDRAIGWSRPTNGTSDYFNACLGVPFSMNVPDNQMGDQAALSGNGYAGFYAFYENDEFTALTNPYREYVTHALSAPMTPGLPYHISFRVSLADVSKFATDDLGALMSTAAPYRDDENPITAAPQISHGGGAWLDDKSGWTLIEGCVIADSAYAFITIGNFNSPANTPFQEVATQFPLTWYCYYFVEDVDVHALPRPDLGPDVETCGSTVLQVTDPQEGVTYLWSTAEVGPSIRVDSSGIYAVSAITEQGCVIPDTIVVDIRPPYPLILDPTASHDFCLSPVITLDAGPLPLDADAHWSTGARGAYCPVTSPGSYSVVVSTPGHCPTSATIEVVNTCADGIFIPNAFSPDADGQNDVWRPVGLLNPNGRLHLRIFDRWGTALVDQHGPLAAWDGTVNGEPAPIGIYAWQLDLQEEGVERDRSLVGHVVLLR